jgi:DNA glycosylase AlkZ-like
MAVAPMTARDLNRATLARQMLLARERVTVAAAVSRLVALQAQLARPPFVGLWTRIDGFRRADLHAALLAKKLVRVTSLRGTLHLMTTADFVGLRGALQPALDKGLQAILKDRLDTIDAATVTAETRKFFSKAPATFDALRIHLKKKYPTGDERAMAYTMRLTLPLVQVPADTSWSFPAAAHFALADEWLGKPVPTAIQPAATLVLRYLAAFGPATPGDAQTWSALGGLREVFEALRPKLVTFRDERKRELFDLPDAPRPSGDTPAPIRFLPEFDNLLLSHDNRTRIIADEHRAHVFSKNLQVKATILVDGVVAGTWKTERKRKTATLTIEPFAPLAKKITGALEEEGGALLQFLESDAESRKVIVKRPA